MPLIPYAHPQSYVTKVVATPHENGVRISLAVVAKNIVSVATSDALDISKAHIAHQEGCAQISPCAPLSLQSLIVEPTPVEPIATTTNIIPFSVVVAQPMDYVNYDYHKIIEDLKTALRSIKGNYTSVANYVTSMRSPEIGKAKLFFAYNVPEKSQQFDALISKYDHTADKYNNATSVIANKLGYVPNGTTMLQHMRYCIVLVMVEIHAKNAINAINAIKAIQASAVDMFASLAVSQEVDAFLEVMFKEFKLYVGMSQDSSKILTSGNGIRKGPFAYSMNLFDRPAKTFEEAFKVFENVCNDINSALIIFENGETSRIRSWLKRAAAYRNTEKMQEALDEFLQISDELYKAEFDIMKPAIKRKRHNYNTYSPESTHSAHSAQSTQMESAVCDSLPSSPM